MQQEGVARTLGVEFRKPWWRSELKSSKDHIKEYISEEDYETLIYWRGIKLMNLGFPQCKTNSGEKDKISTVKSQTEMHFGETYRST